MVQMFQNWRRKERFTTFWNTKIMRYWEYTQSFGIKSSKITHGLSEDLGASKDIIHRMINTFGKSYKRCRSLRHELTPQEPQRREDTCRQLIGNPMDDRFIRRIVIWDKDGSTTSTLTPRNSGFVLVNMPKSSLRKSVWPQCNVMCLMVFQSCDSLAVCNRCGSLFSTTGTSS